MKMLKKPSITGRKRLITVNRSKRRRKQQQLTQARNLNLIIEIQNSLKKHSITERKRLITESTTRRMQFVPTQHCATPHTTLCNLINESTTKRNSMVTDSTRAQRRKSLVTDSRRRQKHCQEIKNKKKAA